MDADKNDSDAGSGHGGGDDDKYCIFQERAPLK
jgi:hypothetical protein